AHKVGDRMRLDYLFLLTCADIRGTNPALWNSWRESLLKDLYRQSVRLLEGSIDQGSLERERADQARAQALALLADQTISAESAEAVWKRFDGDYFLRHTPAELVWQLPAIAGAQEAELPLVMVETIDERGTTGFVYTRDRDHLFGLTTGVLARLGLYILDARLHTTDDGFVLDSYVVIESDNTPIASTMRKDEIRDALR